MDASLLDQALATLGTLLARRGLQFELVTAGGGSLLLLGLGVRATRDLDIVAIVSDRSYAKAQPFPADLHDAACDVGAALGLGDDWLNPGPTDLLDFGLPPGFEQRTVTRTYDGLTLHVASRSDQICLKLYAAVDQGPRSKHYDDLRRLTPTAGELLFAARWTVTHDPSPGFRQQLVEVLHQLGVGDAEL